VTAYISTGTLSSVIKFTLRNYSEFTLASMYCYTECNAQLVLLQGTG
jgi:hypothetical protein